MITDNEIEKDVREELEWSPNFNSENLNVKVNSGMVTISGSLDSLSQKRVAGKIVSKVRGVTSVINEMEVKIAEASERSDSELEQTVFNALKWNSSVPGEKINAIVKKGWITLTGDVALQSEKIRAEKLVERLTGVKGVNNLIHIVTKAVSLNEVRNYITAALERNVNVNGDKINVIVSGQKVTLTGNVRTFSEKQKAEAAAWAAPGVNLVENKLEVIPSEVYA